MEALWDRNPMILVEEVLLDQARIRGIRVLISL